MAETSKEGSSFPPFSFSSFFTGILDTGVGGDHGHVLRDGFGNYYEGNVAEGRTCMRYSFASSFFGGWVGRGNGLGLRQGRGRSPLWEAELGVLESDGLAGYDDPFFDMVGGYARSLSLSLSFSPFPFLSPRHWASPTQASWLMR